MALAPSIRVPNPGITQWVSSSAAAEEHELTTQGSHKTIRAWARARGLTATGPFEYPDYEKFILRETAPPVRHPLPAPRRFQPLHGQPITGILPTFLHVQSQFQLQMERAAGLDLARVKVATPISPLLKLSLGATFAQANAHAIRHLEQARRVREKLPL